jgi:hypothetical protein
MLAVPAFCSLSCLAIAWQQIDIEASQCGLPLNHLWHVASLLCRPCDCAALAARRPPGGGRCIWAPDLPAAHADNSGRRRAAAGGCGGSCSGHCLAARQPGTVATGGSSHQNSSGGSASSSGRRRQQWQRSWQEHIRGSRGFAPWRGVWCRYRNGSGHCGSPCRHGASLGPGHAHNAGGA